MPRGLILLKRHQTSLLNIIMFAIAASWLLCQIFLPASEQPPVLTQALQAAFGVWLTNLAYEQRHTEERIEKRVGQLEDTNVGERVEALEQRAPVAHEHLFGEVIGIQERELAANKAALQLMKDAVEAKLAVGIAVVPETYDAINQLARQVVVLARDIERNKQQQEAEHEAAPEPEEELEPPEPPETSSEVAP